MFAAEASHTRHTDSFFWTSQAAETHKTGAPATLYEVRARAHLIDARSSCTNSHARIARRHSDALAFTTTDEGKAACANALPHLTFDSSSTAANDVHIGNVNTYYDAVAAALARVKKAVVE